MNDEKDALQVSLNSQRQHVLGVLEGLSQEQLRQPALPSGWTPLGMVRHLAIEVEQFWFRGAVAGEPITLTSGDEAWRVPAGESGTSILDLYRDEIARRDAEVVARVLRQLPSPATAQDPPARPYRDGDTCWPPRCGPRTDQRRPMARSYPLTELDP
jgi:hypothetical protein